MNLSTDSLFQSHVDPMWIYDLETLRFLAVNDAAIGKYGHTRAEFLAMTIADIRPEEDRAAVEKNVAAVIEGRKEAGVWRHFLKSGEQIYVDITGHTIDYGGRRAELIAARDVSRFVLAEQRAREALQREADARRASDALAAQFQSMFDTIPGIFLVLSPEEFNVIAVSDAYLEMFDCKRSGTVGRSIFNVLSRHVDETTRAKLRSSFGRVLATKQTDRLELLTFAESQSASEGADDRLWAISTTPAFGPSGRVLHIILRLQDVSAAVNLSAGDARINSLEVESARLEIVEHTRDLRTRNIALTELTTRLRASERMLQTGTWDYVLAEDRLDWSSDVYDIYGVTSETFGHRFEDYVSLIQSDDRAAMRARFDAFMSSSETELAFTHQVRHVDGRMVHVHGVAEKRATPNGLVLSGVVQNVTERVEAANALAQAKRMLEIAGTSAKFGAWRYDLQSDHLEWSPQITRIHEEPDGFSPRIEAAIQYYAPEHRRRVRALFQSCIELGEPFNEVLEIITAKGRRLWVRATGEAERDDEGTIIAVQGSLQDISELVIVRMRAEESEKLLEIAGQAVRLGGWRVSLLDRKVSWSEGVAAIHEVPPGTVPTFEGGLDYFAANDRDAAQLAFESCACDGIPFDNVHDLLTAKGNRIKVRSMGNPVRDASGKIIAVQGAMQDISELIEARAQAEQLSQMVLRTFESIRDGFFTLDREWRFGLINSEGSRILSMDKALLVDRVIWDVFPHLEASDFGINYKRALDCNETQRFVAYSIDMGRWYDVAAFPSDEGISIYFQDVTARRAEQQQLRLLEASVARLNDIVIITEAENVAAPEGPVIVYVNPAFERRTGFTREEALGQTPRILQGPKTQRAELNHIRRALETCKPVRAEVINYTKSGSEYWVEMDIVPVADGTGQYTHFVSVERDITERRRAEETLLLSEERFRLIARATGNAVWEWDSTREPEWWCAGFAEIFGVYPEPGAQLPDVWRANVHTDDKRRIDEAWGRMMSGQTASMHEKYRFRRANGNWSTVEDRAFAIYDKNRKAIRILGSMTDISERVLLEDQLHQSQKLEAIGRLTGGIAHDFNNLLTIIIGNTELLQDELDKGHPLRQYADMTSVAADRASELTNRLLAFSRKQALRPKIIDVNAVIGGLEGMLRRTLGEQVDIDILCTDGVWSIEADPAQLESALLNLAINSRDAMPNGGLLKIETGNVLMDGDYVALEPGLNSGRYVVIAVSDTGQGIPRDQIDRVFEPFFTTKEVGKGTGLGLSMVYGFAKQTGGHVKIYSEPEFGTTVKLYFPRLVET